MLSILCCYFLHLLYKCNRQPMVQQVMSPTERVVGAAKQAVPTVEVSDNFLEEKSAVPVSTLTKCWLPIRSDESVGGMNIQTLELTLPKRVPNDASPATCFGARRNYGADNSRASSRPCCSKPHIGTEAGPVHFMAGVRGYRHGVGVPNMNTPIRDHRLHVCRTHNKESLRYSLLTARSYTMVLVVVSSDGARNMCAKSGAQSVSMDFCGRRISRLMSYGNS